MTAQLLLQGQRDHLQKIIRESFGRTPQADGFAARVFTPTAFSRLVPEFRFDTANDPGVAFYEGFPRLAYLGFGLATGAFTRDLAGSTFLLGLQRLRGRSEHSLSSFTADDVAVLGVADGLASFLSDPRDESAALRNWLVQIVVATPRTGQWSSRMRALAGDLLDNRGRLYALPPTEDLDALALDYALRAAYPKPFFTTPAPSNEARDSMLKALLTSTAPPEGELDRAVVWLVAMDQLIDAACTSLIPSVSDTARLLANVQHALKRWQWQEEPQRRRTLPTRWLIDDEFDVQSLLWAMLYPVYGADLVDETYLPNWGNVQPRADLAIIKLKLIIEVKFARQPSDFNSIEGQVGEDLGLYFKDTNLFDRMIVFVYDDCDKPQPERYDALRNALVQRERVEEVIIVRRPSMIPNRGARS